MWVQMKPKSCGCGSKIVPPEILPSLSPQRAALAAGLRGFAASAEVEPAQGSTAGGTELHVAGAGFASVTQALGMEGGRLAWGGGLGRLGGRVEAWVGMLLWGRAMGWGFGVG